MGSLSHLNKYLFKYRWRLMLGMAFIIIQNVVFVLNPLVVKTATDFVSEALSVGSSALAEEGLKFPSLDKLNTSIASSGYSISTPEIGTRAELLSFVSQIGISLCLLFLGIALFKGFFLFLTRQTIIIMSRLIEYDMKNEIYDQYQALSPSFYKKNNTGDLMNRISEDVGKVRMYLGPAIMYTLNLVVVAALCLYMMIKLSPELTLYVVAPLPIMSILIYKVSRIMNQRNEAAQRQQSALSTFVQENFAGIRVMKSYGLEARRTEAFTKESNTYRELYLERVKVDALFMPTIILLIGLSTLLSIFMGGRMIVNGADLTIGDMNAFVIYVNMLTWPFASVGWVTSLVQQAAASQTRINEFLKEVPDIQDGPETLPEVKGHIRFEDVTFTYPESGIKGLDKVNISLSPGKTLGIFGRTGSGKSTLTAMLTRQFDPDSGRITLDDVNIKELELSALRKQMGYVPQEVFLFSDTIANNIAFGLDETATREQIIQAGKDAELDSEIAHFPDGYDTLLGEWGVTLSGGQKQRVSLARAIIKRPKVLIFDDSLSAVDTETEEHILQTLDEIIAERSTILISHRISTIKRADHIIVLEKGAIVAQGKHEELMAEAGFYADMEHKQSLEIGSEIA